MFGWFLTRIDLNSAFLRESLDRQEEVYVRPPPTLKRCGFTERAALYKIKKALCGFRSAPRLWGLLRNAVLAAPVMCFEGREYALRQSCAGLALRILDWLGGETGLLCLDDQGQEVGSIVECVLTHVDDMLAAGDIQILQSFVVVLKKNVRSLRVIIGPSQEGEITYTGMWIVAMSGGGFGVQQCPYVSDVLNTFGMGECRRATTFGSQIPRNSKCPQVMFLTNSVAIRCSLRPKMCRCHVVVVHQVQT